MFESFKFFGGGEVKKPKEKPIDSHLADMQRETQKIGSDVAKIGEQEIQRELKPESLRIEDPAKAKEISGVFQTIGTEGELRAGMDIAAAKQETQGIAAEYIGKRRGPVPELSGRRKRGQNWYDEYVAGHLRTQEEVWQEKIRRERAAGYEWNPEWLPKKPEPEVVPEEETPAP